MPGFGGPTGVAEAPTTAGATVYTYGNSELRGGVTKLSPKQGAVAAWSQSSLTIRRYDSMNLVTPTWVIHSTI